MFIIIKRERDSIILTIKLSSCLDLLYHFMVDCRSGKHGMRQLAGLDEVHHSVKLLLFHNLFGYKRREVVLLIDEIG